MTTTSQVHNDFTMMLVVHDAFRRDLRRIASALDAAAHGGTGRGDAPALLERWQWAAEQIHHHHGGEDAVLWPALREALRDDAPALQLLDRMEHEHGELAPLQAAVDGALHAYAAAPSAATAQAALVPCRAFADALGAHLAHEERDAVPLLESRLPPVALRRFEQRQQRQLGLRVAMTQFFPWLLDEALPQRREHVLGQLPAPLRWLVVCSTPGYRRRTARAWV